MSSIIIEDITNHVSTSTPTPTAPLPPPGVEDITNQLANSNPMFDETRYKVILDPHSIPRYYRAPSIDPNVPEGTTINSIQFYDEIKTLLNAIIIPMFDKIQKNGFLSYVIASKATCPKTFANAYSNTPEILETTKYMCKYLPLQDEATDLIISARNHGSLVHSFDDAVNAILPSIFLEPNLRVLEVLRSDRVKAVVKLEFRPTTDPFIVFASLL